MALTIVSKDTTQRELSACVSCLLVDTNGGGNDNLGLFATSGSGVVQIVREGEFAPNSTRAFTLFFNFEQNDSGQVAFYGFFNDATVKQGIYRGDGGALTESPGWANRHPMENASSTNFLPALVPMVVAR